MPEFPTARRRAEGVAERCASPQGEVAPDAVKAAVSGERPVRKLFSKAQRAFFAEHAPDGVTLDDLSVHGPIFQLKLKSTGERGRRLVTEMWLYPDGSRILELSTKCATNEAFQVAAEGRAMLVPRGVDRRASSTRRRQGARVLLRRATGRDRGGVSHGPARRAQTAPACRDARRHGPSPPASRSRGASRRSARPPTGWSRRSTSSRRSTTRAPCPTKLEAAKRKVLAG